MARGTTDISLSELEAMLHQRRSLLEQMVSARDQVEKELGRLDAAIQSLSGDGSVRPTAAKSTAGVTRKVRTRSTNSVSLRKLVIQLLADHSDGLSLQDLSDKVFATGYQSTSKNFRNVLYQCLYNIKDAYHDSASGVYRLNAGKTPVKAKRKGAKKAKKVAAAAAAEG